MPERLAEEEDAIDQYMDTVKKKLITESNSNLHDEL